MMSTKCQYHADNENLLWFWMEILFFFRKISGNDKKMIPTKTCLPWRPVIIKKILLNEESLKAIKEKFLNVYSDICISRNAIPRKMVLIKLVDVLLKLFLIR